MEPKTAKWWKSASDAKRRAVLFHSNITPETDPDCECFSYGLVHASLPAYAERVVETAYQNRKQFDEVK